MTDPLRTALEKARSWIAEFPRGHCDEKQRADDLAEVDAALAQVEPPLAVGVQPIETGDHVLHKPSGETWLVAMVEDGYLTCCGWPESVVPLTDCELVKKATLREAVSLLHSMAKSDGRRARFAAGLLAPPAGHAAVTGQIEPDPESKA